jgi:peptidoglycan/LPS O-acetylase OafA/YrhL
MHAAGARPGTHVPGLDGLRGLAAAVVVARHSFNAVELDVATRRALLEGPLALVLNAQGAVQLFFVLSGYVLAASLSRHRSPADLAQYFVKRAFRLHPPYVLGVLAAWSASFLYFDPARAAGVSDWVSGFARVHLPPGRLLASLGFPGIAYGQLPVGWSLYVEAVFSALMPALLWLARRSHWSLLVGVAFAWALRSDDTTPWLYTLDFALGIAAFSLRASLGPRLAALAPAAGAAGLAAALVLFCAPLLLGWTRPGHGILIGGFAPREVALTGAAAALLVLGTAHVPWLGRVLAVRPVAFLGRVSYSLYLLHFPVLVVCAPLAALAPGPPGALLLFAVVLALSLPLAALAYRAVERPAIRLGNALCARLARRLGTEPVASRRAED